MTKAKEEPSFEQDLEQLEAIVTALEEGGLSLDESLKRFEEGIKLARRCEKALGNAEKKIEVLTKTAEGELEAKPFDEAETAEGPAAAAPPKPRGKARKEPEDEPLEEEPEDDEELLF